MMDKNSIIGFILIALILFGFTFFESSQSRKRAEAQRQLDSIAQAQMPRDTMAVAQAVPEVPAEPASGVAEQQGAIYTDAFLESARQEAASFVSLENELVKIDFTTRGAQPSSVLVKKYSSL